MSKNIMVDLETLGTTPGCVILSIGAVEFNLVSKMLGSEFYQVINTPSCEHHGLIVDKDTIKWWGNQSDEARKVINDAASIESSEHLIASLDYFTDWLVQFNLKGVRIWGNGSDFDNAILAYAYVAIHKRLPWKFWNNRCYRTLKSLSPFVKLEKNLGTAHNALDDAKTQAINAIKMLC